MMTTHWILWVLVLGMAKSESQISETITLTDDTCGTLYFGVKKDHYLVWDGSHIGKDYIWVGFTIYKDSGSCSVTFDPAIDYTVCVTVEKFHIEDCNATVNYYHNGDPEIKATYGCNTTPGSFCGTGKGVEVEIAYKGKSPPGSSDYFKLKITLHKKRDLSFLIILAPPVGFIIIVVIVVVCHRTKSERLAFRKSKIDHSRLVNELIEPTQPSLENNCSYSMNQLATREFVVAVPVAVNFR